EVVEEPGAEDDVEPALEGRLDTPGRELLDVPEMEGRLLERIALLRAQAVRDVLGAPLDCDDLAGAHLLEHDAVVAVARAQLEDAQAAEVHEVEQVLHPLVAAARHRM